MKDTWHLNPSDIETFPVSTVRSGRGSNFAKKPSIMDERSYELRLTHIPTQIVVSGSIEPGHYKREEMKRKMTELEKRLLTELENKVAKHLRIPGR